MVETGIVIFFVAVPAIAAYQSGRSTVLLLPAALLLVSIEWVVVSGGEGLSAVGLCAAAVGLALSAYLVRRSA